MSGQKASNPSQSTRPFELALLVGNVGIEIELIGVELTMAVGAIGIEEHRLVHSRDRAIDLRVQAIEVDQLYVATVV